MCEADLIGASLNGADLRGADLHGAKLTLEQLAQAASLEDTKLPVGTDHTGPRQSWPVGVAQQAAA